MSSLNLTVENIDNDDASAISSHPPKKINVAATWIKSALGQERPTLPRNVWTGKRECTETKVAGILRDFLQSDSKMSLKKAAESLLVLIPANAPAHAEVFFFGEIVVELAEQIPYDHPPHLKFAQFLRFISRSPKFASKYYLLPQEEGDEPFQLLAESTGDTISGPDEENHSGWVNLNAFMANLYATGVWGTSTGWAVSAMQSAFESEKLGAAWEQDCYIMAAAQWILWHGQTLFKLIIYDGLQEDEGGNFWGFGDKLENSKMAPRSVERWRFWNAGFEAVGRETEASGECKRVALRASGLMGSIEQNMLF